MLYRHKRLDTNAEILLKAYLVTAEDEYTVDTSTRERRDPLRGIVAEVGSVSPHTRGKFRVIEVVRDAERRETRLGERKVDEGEGLVLSRGDESGGGRDLREVRLQGASEAGGAIDLEEDESFRLLLHPHPECDTLVPYFGGRKTRF